MTRKPAFEQKSSELRHSLNRIRKLPRLDAVSTRTNANNGCIQSEKQPTYAIGHAIGQQNAGANLQNPTETHILALTFKTDDDPVRMFTDKIDELTKEMASTTNPDRLQELSKTITLLRRARKNEQSASRLRERHREERRHRRSRRRQNLTQNSRPDQFDPLKLFSELLKLTDQYPLAARTVAKELGIENLDQVEANLERLLNDPEETKHLQQFFVNGLKEIISATIMKFELSKTPAITPGPQQQTATSQPPQWPFWSVRDPRGPQIQQDR